MGGLELPSLTTLLNGNLTLEVVTHVQCFKSVGFICGGLGDFQI